MKKKKIYISGLIVLIVILTGAFFAYRYLTNENKLTSAERTWINTNFNALQNIYVLKDENIFSKDGHGVFYDFLDSFSEEYGLNLNIITFASNDTPSGINLNKSKNINDNTKVFYTDHYVLLSKEASTFNTIEDLDGLTVGLLNSDLEFIKNYLKDENINYNGYDTIDELFASIGTTINYIILPRMEYLDKILENNLEIVYHLSDIKNYYTLNGINDNLSNILAKYFNKWEDNINSKIKDEEFTIFKNSLGITDSEITDMLSVNYNYGFVNNSPYEVIMSGNYGGIVSEYLQEFSEFSDVYFNIKKYSNIEKLNKALNKDKIDIYFDFNTNINNNYTELKEGINGSLAIIINKKSAKVINSVYGLQGEEVYVQNNSHLKSYLESVGAINIKTYDNLKGLFKLNKKDVIIVLDTYIFDYYSKTKLSNYTSIYNTYFNQKYHFKVKSNYATLNKLMDKYMNYLDDQSIINKGLASHAEIVKKGSILNNIAIYFILIIVLILVIGFVLYKRGKRIHIRRRLKKDDKIRFIDDLTCLKNRAYLSDFIKTWSNNTIYPQTIIVVDLNRLKEINDKYGVSEGDKQIQAAANALIKTQLDNSDLMRSDGNEFVIYTVGYNKKQIINYLHKLNKELKKLPYDFGAEFGYSIIENNLKTIEDALNEATNDMKKKKVGEESDK